MRSVFFWESARLFMPKIINRPLQTIYEKNTSIPKNRSISDFANIFNCPTSTRIAPSSPRIRLRFFSDNTEPEAGTYFKGAKCNSLRRCSKATDLTIEDECFTPTSDTNLTSVESVPSEDLFSVLIKNLEIPPNFAEGRKVHLHTSELYYAKSTAGKLLGKMDSSTWGLAMSPFTYSLMIDSIYQLERNNSIYGPSEKVHRPIHHELPFYSTFAYAHLSGSVHKYDTAKGTPEEEELIRRIQDKNNWPNIRNTLHGITAGSGGIIPIGPFVGCVDSMLKAHKYRELKQYFEEVHATYSIPECDPEYFKTMFYLDVMREEYLKDRELEEVVKRFAYGTALLSSAAAWFAALFTGGVSLALGVPSIALALYEGVHPISNWFAENGLQKELRKNFEELEAMTAKIQELKREIQEAQTLMDALEIEERYQIVKKDEKDLIAKIKHLNTELIKMHSDLMALRALDQLFPEKDENKNDPDILKNYLRAHTPPAKKAYFDTAYAMLKELWSDKNKNEDTIKKSIAIFTYLQTIAPNPN